MNDDIKKELKGILDEYKSGLIGKADFEAKMKAIEDKVDALDQTKSIDEIREIIKEQGRTISLMQKSTVSSENEAQEKIKAFFSGKENIDAVKGGRTVSIEIEMKAEAAAMTTTTAAVPIAAFNTEVVPGIAAAATEPNAILPRLQKGTTSSPTIKWINRKDPDGGSAFIAEGTLKPLMSWGYEEETSTAKKVAVRAKLSTEILEDADFIRGEVNTLLRQDLMQTVEEKVIAGTGTGNEILGVTTKAPGYTITELNGKISMPNIADVVRAGVLQLRLLHFSPDVLFLHPTDKAIFDVTKDTAGHYLTDEMRKIIGNISVVETTNIPAGKFLLMDSSRWKVRPYRALRLEWGRDGDDFSHNMVTVIAEMRLHSYQNSIDVGSVIYDDFATVQAALEKTAEAAA